MSILRVICIAVASERREKPVFKDWNSLFSLLLAGTSKLERTVAFNKTFPAFELEGYFDYMLDYDAMKSKADIPDMRDYDFELKHSCVVNYMSKKLKLDVYLKWEL